MKIYILNLQQEQTQEKSKNNVIKQQKTSTVFLVRTEVLGLTRFLLRENLE